ncbi:hypothetical protein BP5796_03102 [Coleophoma crateriformis]|uniref:Uncharacterized protein n=1 Tax=Coleophoma crateriformis TaxID=565419 RepID=A0A3D8SNN2_9HELO|nr:hypothetical protein BP5796_03102 [Coleophoma crateriformis]
MPPLTGQIQDWACIPQNSLFQLEAKPVDDETAGQGEKKAEGHQATTNEKTQAVVVDSPNTLAALATLVRSLSAGTIPILLAQPDTTVPDAYSNRDSPVVAGPDIETNKTKSRGLQSSLPNTTAKTVKPNPPRSKIGSNQDRSITK